ncbi:MAG: DNA-binding response regulator [Salinivirgaceae bacterium]|nr:MAG: DNA-binding response regulator [Salinivirgaceae bacterium]
MLKSIIIDDEIASIESLEFYLHSIDSNVNIVGKALNIQEAETLINQKKPDLVFLDIEMPNGNGFDLLDKFDTIDFHIIFITAFNQYAIKAFKYAAIDYILKPVDVVNLQNAINRVKKLTESNFSNKYPALKHNLSEEKPKRLALATQESIEIVLTQNIVQFEADGNYTTVRILDRAPIIVSKSLGEYEEILKEDTFYRCHKSHLINLQQIQKVIKNQNQIIMVDETKAIISRRRKQDFFEVMQEFINQ